MEQLGQQSSPTPSAAPSVQAHIRTELLDMAAHDLDWPIDDWWSHDTANRRCRRYAQLVEQLLRKV